MEAPSVYQAYDPFQKEAIGYIKQGLSVIVSAPTGAGKTAIAEYVIHDCIAGAKKAIYTAPIKALSNQKYRDFQRSFHDTIGILTGDVSINPSAPILIMTTEIFRNKTLEEGSGLDQYAWIIFDEIHYIDDYERGTVWEESLLFLPPHMKILALSATIPNIDEFAHWISSIRGQPIRVVRTEERPVPLHFFYQCQGEIADSLGALKKHSWHQHKGYPQGRGRISRYEPIRPNKPTSLIKHLLENKRLPCIYFVFNRRRCEYLADEMRGFDLLNEEEKQSIRALYDNLCQRFGLAKEKTAHLLLPYIERGIAYHHAGMLPTIKEAVEQLFTSRLIKVIFTTETFALGINMPARTVVFDELRKYYGRGFEAMRTRDFYQMAGRAGRRGIDTEGFVYSRVNPHETSSSELHRIIYGRPEDVYSRFNLSYATILNLYATYGEKIYEIYPRSFYCFQARKKNRSRGLDLLYAKVSLLKELGYIQKNQLTQKGAFAAKVYGYELSLTELYASGTLEHLTEVELAIVSLALVFEPRKNNAIPPLNNKTRQLSHATNLMIEQIHRKEKRLKISPWSKHCSYHLTPALEAWVEREPFNKILQYTDVDEGEVIRYFRMGIQLLRQLLDTPITQASKERIKNLLLLINRDIVDAERQLRE